MLIENEVTQSCPPLCDPMGCSLPRSSIHGIFQTRVLEWVAISFSRGSSRPRDQTQVSRIVGRCFTVWATSWCWCSIHVVYLWVKSDRVVCIVSVCNAELERELPQRRQKNIHTVEIPDTSSKKTVYRQVDLNLRSTPFSEHLPQSLHAQNRNTSTYCVLCNMDDAREHSNKPYALASYCCAHRPSGKVLSRHGVGAE